jgi:hypothetical protein
VSTAGGNAFRQSNRNPSRTAGTSGTPSGATSDRYISIIIELEIKRLIDEQTASLIKTLILEENLEVFNPINLYIAKSINDRELSHRLLRLA